MRKYKQVKKSKDIFDMKELAEAEHPPPLRKTDQSGEVKSESKRNRERWL